VSSSSRNGSSLTSAYFPREVGACGWAWPERVAPSVAPRRPLAGFKRVRSWVAKDSAPELIPLFLSSAARGPEDLKCFASEIMKLTIELSDIPAHHKSRKGSGKKMKQRRERYGKQCGRTGTQMLTLITLLPVKQEAFTDERM